MKSHLNTGRNSFKEWVWKSKENRLLLGFSIAVTVGQFFWFKWEYPFPNFLPDSYSYLLAAFNNQNINTWPIGYSKFLRLFSAFSHVDSALIFFQYSLVQGSIIYFLLTLSYQLRLRIWVVRAMFLLLIGNPLNMHISNFISSDAVFAALSIIWFTQLLWILYDPNPHLLIMHSVILLLVFTMRYNALFYPFISVICILVCRAQMQLRLAGIALLILFIAVFIAGTINQYKKYTNTSQFSAFGGWQIASNALFAYAHVRPLERDVPSEFIALHTLANKHMDSLNKLTHRPDSSLGIYYLWEDLAPLKQYMANQYLNDHSTGIVKRWATVSPLYKKYGLYLIKKYPIEYVRYYLLPNSINFYVPQTEFLASYNMHKDTVEYVAEVWFKYKTNKVHSNAKQKAITIAEYFPISFAAFNILFLMGAIGFVLLKGFKNKSDFFITALRISIMVWMFNFLFSISASPIVMRYQVFPLIITTAYSVLLLNCIIERARKRNKQQLEGIQVEEEEQIVSLS